MDRVFAFGVYITQVGTAYEVVYMELVIHILYIRYNIIACNYRRAKYQLISIGWIFFNV